jgi:O-antigen/teichoic acid export membrane protein
VNRLSIFPGSLVLTLFPAFSSLDARGATERMESLYARSVKFLLLILGPIVAVLIVLARDILRLWLGADFSTNSTLVLQILAVGILLNSLAYLPLALIQGVGRPDVAARFHLFELPLYAFLLWFGVTRMGIPGAALAWTVRVGCDALLLFGGAAWLKMASLRSLVDHGILRGFAAIFLFGVLLWLPLRHGSALWTKLVLSTAMLLPYAAGSWRFVLDDADRDFLAGSVGRALASFGVGR